MKNDKRIKKVLKELQSNIDTILSMPNFDAYTDQLIENVLTLSTDLQKLYMENFSDNLNQTNKEGI